LELNHITNCSCNFVWRVCQSTIGISDFDDVDHDLAGLSKGAADAESRKSKSSELHIDDGEKVSISK